MPISFVPGLAYILVAKGKIKRNEVLFPYFPMGYGTGLGLGSGYNNYTDITYSRMSRWK